MLTTLRQMLFGTLIAAIASVASLALADHGHGGHGGWSGGHGGWNGGHSHVSFGHGGFNNWGGRGIGYSHFYGRPYYNSYYRPFASYYNYYRPYFYGYYGYPYRYGYYNYPYAYYYGYPSPTYYYSTPEYYAYDDDYYADSAPPQEYVVSRPVLDVARMEVRLPDPAATLWVEGKQMSTTGAVRHFKSPQLDPSQKYTYNLRAEWRDGDRVVNENRQVQVQPNTNTVVDFTKPAAGAVIPPQDKTGPNIPPPQPPLPAGS